VDRDLRHAAEERDAYLATRVDLSDEGLRDVAHRVSLVNTRVDEVGQRIADVRKELARASEQQVRARFKQVQQELEEVVELNRRIVTSDGTIDESAPQRPTLRSLDQRDYATGQGS
jgi:predicted  nucleic acid-binding Zn-ribbon protein